jgi:hypothetical protein
MVYTGAATNTKPFLRANNRFDPVRSAKTATANVIVAISRPIEISIIDEDIYPK